MAKEAEDRCAELLPDLRREASVWLLGPELRVFIIRIIIYWGSMLGSPDFGNCPLGLPIQHEALK